MPRATAAVPATGFVTGLSEVAPRYDAIFCDVWGVLHDGLTAPREAGEALSRFRAEGGQVILVSNAPRPGASVVRQLDRFGVPRGAFDTIVTSGDLTQAAIAERRMLVVHHLGPERDRGLFTGLELRFGTVEDSDYVVCSGLFDDEAEAVDDYRPTLARMRERGLLMICANPDLVVERGDRLVPCAGALAQLYEELGGEVFYAGKPHRPVYQAAHALAEKAAGRPLALDRLLGLGDAIRTDIAGARGFGVDAMLVARGIHTDELRLREGSIVLSHVQDWIERQTARPTWVLERLIW